jgi:hypothetical protein
VSVNVEPSQIGFILGEIVTAGGGGLNEIFVFTDIVQPALFVTVKVYIPVAVAAFALFIEGF